MPAGTEMEINGVFEDISSFILLLAGLMISFTTIASIFDSIYSFFSYMFGRDLNTNLLFFRGHCTLDYIRIGVGHTINFSLEFIVAAELIQLIQKFALDSSFDSIKKLGIIITIRTILTIVLQRELNILEKKMKSQKNTAH